MPIVLVATECQSEISHQNVVTIAFASWVYCPGKDPRFDPPSPPLRLRHLVGSDSGTAPARRLIHVVWNTGSAEKYAVPG